MRLLFIGDSWLGSNARSMREALARQPGTLVEEIGRDLIIPTAATIVHRLANRLLLPLMMRELEGQIVKIAESFRPDAIIFYKGTSNAAFIRRLQQAFAPVVNIFPDYSPNAFGPVMTEAMGVYDLVISTKPYFPANWRGLYGYSNRCETVLHGYNPTLHYRGAPPHGHDYDVGIIATGRPEYSELLGEVASRLMNKSLRVFVAGNDWAVFRSKFPKHWNFPGEQLGQSYVECLRRAKIVIAPLHTRVVVNGKTQPGDVDTSRSYQLPAAYCFFLHRRTEFIKTIYDEMTEVPMYDDGVELAQKIDYYLDCDEERAARVAAARARAVPAYSFDQRAREVLQHINNI